MPVLIVPAHQVVHLPEKVWWPQNPEKCKLRVENCSQVGLLGSEDGVCGEQAAYQGGVGHCWTVFCCRQDRIRVRCCVLLGECVPEFPQLSCPDSGPVILGHYIEVIGPDR